MWVSERLVYKSREKLSNKISINETKRIHHFSRHRCTHDQEKNVIVKTDNTETSITAYQNEFSDRFVLDETLVRTSIKRPTDNLKPEGDFERPTKTEYTPAQRPIVKKPEDNLKVSGDYFSKLL